MHSEQRLKPFSKIGPAFILTSFSSTISCLSSTIFLKICGERPCSWTTSTTKEFQKLTILDSYLVKSYLGRLKSSKVRLSLNISMRDCCSGKTCLKTESSTRLHQWTTWRVGGWPLLVPSTQTNISQLFKKIQKKVNISTLAQTMKDRIITIMEI